MVNKSVLEQAHLVIVRFLESQGYTESLEAFRREAGLESDPSEITSTALDLRDVVEDYLSSRLKSIAITPVSSLDEELKALVLTKPLPSSITQTITQATNVLIVKSGIYPKRSWDAGEGRFISEFIPCVISASVDRTIRFYSAATFDVLDEHSVPSPVLSVDVHPTLSRFLVASTMEGSVLLIDLVTREVQKLKDHNKYVVRAVWSPDGKWVATAGYDKLINIYEVVEGEVVQTNALLDDELPDELGMTSKRTLVKRHSEITRTNPEGMIFLRDSSALVYSAREDHILHYIDIPTFALSGYNMNPNNDSWVSFSILTISLHPTLPILCLQTSTDSARLLLYPFRSASRLSTIYTTAEQSEFCTPRHTFLPDGTGVVVTSEDGVIRVVDLDGKVRLRVGAHGTASPHDDGPVEGRSERVRARREVERGSSVIKDVAVLVDSRGQFQFVSGGFDRTMRVITVVAP